MKRLMLILLLLASSQSALAAINAWLDSYQIKEGEVLRLSIEAEGDIPGDPNTDPLLPDFEVQGIANGHRQIRGANGFINYSTWSISLKPRHAGVLQLPPLQIAGQSTPPLSVEVRAAKAAHTDQGEILILGEVSNTQPWVQSMVTYTISILYNTPIAEGTLTLPDIPNALVHRLKGDRIATIERNGQRYKRIERRYAVFPQSSGRLTIPGPVLNAKVPAANQGRRLNANSNPLQSGSGDFDTFVTATRSIRVRGQSLVLDVTAPAGESGASGWLPAQRIELTETTDRRQVAIRAGEPVTRTITLRAHGLLAEQIPPLEQQGDSHDGIYFDKPVRHNRIDADGIIGTLTQRVVYVPRQAGSLELPEMTVRWWDVNANGEKISTLPAQHYEVIAAEGEEPPATATPPTPPVMSASAADSSRDFLHHLSQPKPWQWLSATLASLWLLTLLLWRHERGHCRTANVRHNKPPSNTLARKRFQQACRENLAGPARHYLLEWCQSHWPDNPPIGLEDLAQRIGNDKLTPLLRQLDKAVYAGKKHQWHGRKLAGKLKKLPRIRPRVEPTGTLPPLYPG